MKVFLISHIADADGIMPVIKLDYEKYIIPTFFEYVRMFLEDVFK